MVRPPVRGDNQRAYAHGLSPVQMDKYGLTIYTIYISVDLAYYEIFLAKVDECCINDIWLLFMAALWSPARKELTNWLLWRCQYKKTVFQFGSPRK